MRHPNRGEESWESEPGIPGTILVDMAFDDMPLPANDPNATEAIFTTAAGLGDDGPIKLLRRTRINRTGNGPALHDAVDLKTGIRDDGLAALLALALAAGSTPSNAPTGNSVAPREQHHCPSCGVCIGHLHTDACDIGWCSAVGRQRDAHCSTTRGCRTDPRLDCRTVWTGLHPGIAECREFGWFAVRGPDGWTSAAPGTIGAIEDLNRLIADKAVWNPAAQCYKLPDDTLSGEPGLPPSDQASGEAG